MGGRREGVERRSGVDTRGGGAGAGAAGGRGGWPWGGGPPPPPGDASLVFALAAVAWNFYPLKETKRVILARHVLLIRGPT